MIDVNDSVLRVEKVVEIPKFIRFDHQISNEELLDSWGEQVLEEADKAMKVSEDIDTSLVRSRYARGYSDGLRMALTFFNRMERVNKGMKK